MDTILAWAAIMCTGLAAPDGRDRAPNWTAPSLPYRVLVEVPATDIAGRASDALPAALDLDARANAFTSLNLPGPVDLDSIQVLRYDPTTGKALPGPVWPFARAKGERASRFLDKSLPWNFPMPSRWVAPGGKPGTFARGAHLVNARGTGNPGLLVWGHTQDGDRPSHYAVYFRCRPPAEKQKIPRQGFIGDGSPRRDAESGRLTGTLYNRCDVDDWDGDGLVDMIVGVGFGNVLLFRNEGDRTEPKFGWGKYLFDADGRPLDVGYLASPRIVDWNGDEKRDLLVTEEGVAGLYWYENTGSDAERKLAFRGRIRADGADIVVPHKPCPESPHYKKDYAPSIEVVDWENDGDLDLLLGGYITGRIWYYENVGNAADGTPTLKFRGPLEADGKPIDTQWGAHPCVVDLDADGDLDLLTGSFGQRSGGGDTFHRFLVRYDNVGTRNAPKLTEARVEYDGAAPREILAQPRACDFNSDGLTDLVISTFGSVYLAKNVGTKRSPRWRVELQHAAWGLSPLSATQITDLNGDGHLDLITSPLDGHGGPRVSLNTGKGTHGLFESSQPLVPKAQAISHPAPYGDPWAFTYLHDFDRDGDLDILWADGPGNAYLHRNRGSAEHPDYDRAGEKLMTVEGVAIKVGPPVVAKEQIKDFTMMQGSRAGICAEDFDRDGKTDLAMGDTYGDVYYFANVGSNAKPLFANRVKLGNLHNRAIPLTYDWDGDGLVDLLGVAWSGKMEWYRNQGPDSKPQFESPQKLNLPPTVPYSPRLVVADWNHDGDDDFLVMSSYPWFCWLEGSYVRHGYVRARIASVERKE